MEGIKKFLSTNVERRWKTLIENTVDETFKELNKRHNHGDNMNGCFFTKNIIKKMFRSKVSSEIKRWIERNELKSNTSNIVTNDPPRNIYNTRTSRNFSNINGTSRTCENCKNDKAKVVVNCDVCTCDKNGCEDCKKDFQQDMECKLDFSFLCKECSDFGRGKEFNLL